MIDDHETITIQADGHEFTFRPPTHAELDLYHYGSIVLLLERQKRAVAAATDVDECEKAAAAVSKTLSWICRRLHQAMTAGILDGSLDALDELFERRHPTWLVNGPLADYVAGILPTPEARGN